MTRELTPEERRAVAALKRLAKTWPSTLWLFSASGSLNVMQKDENLARVRRGDAIDPDMAVATIDIENDGGDW